MNHALKKNKKIFLISLIIAGIILLVAVIFFLLVKLKVKNKNIKNNDNNENQIIYLENCNNIKCSICIYSENNQICTASKDAFKLFNGECIQYAFIALYNITRTNTNNYIQIFNPNKNNSLFAMHIGSSLISPISKYRFHSNENKIYFYLDENKNISLSYLFEGINELIDFSFNDKYINNFNIIDMKGMLLGCSSLNNISFYSFKGKDLIDISYLFSNCTSLKSIDLSSLNSRNIKYMNNLFSKCKSLITINISKLDTENLVNMSSMFYDCEALTSLNISNFNTKNVVDMSFMFYKCLRLYR